MRRLAAAAVGLVAMAAPLAAACGGATTLPEVPPCATPTPIPSVSGRTPRESDFRYIRAVNEGATRLIRLTNDFRTRWPDGKFSSRTEFREEFALYASNMACAASALRDMKSSVTRYAEWDGRFDAVMSDYVAAMEQGRESVRTRNVSDYRRFNKRVDEVNAALAEALVALP